ncbi:bifunctional nicotinamidase/pyrazinamidase [Fuchsiella alkaliacetigena]|uniref:bifunctional nicotinamidase/pyrazinamidase n=1 Tax=Fuchsiella alkaliacetigena TaxID=957042 RepID=UPI00200A301E|nr:bifunctional nicotinamidase/pyrazinamidase [Fuchsiella alkaliacetigena]MCK8825800.1 bifunctional nicotinamidase/pyrazinamidase [Fuchsiella alkaliacetigena]
MNKALLVIDVQNDFYSQGSLPVPDAEEINVVINKLLASEDYKLVVASQDWHPQEHLSFAVNLDREPFARYSNEQGIGPLLWPVHCRQGSQGAEFHPEINSENFDYIIRKGTDLEVDSYSAFRENNGKDLGLAALLKGLGIEEIDVCGLALDFCVKFTALDGIEAGFKVNLLEKATKGVGANPGDIYQALEELEEAGVNIKEGV